MHYFLGTFNATIDQTNVASCRQGVSMALDDEAPAIVMILHEVGEECRGPLSA